MAGLFCTFLNFRSSSTKHYTFHLILPSKNTSTPLSFSSSFSKCKRKPLLCKPASPVIDVISTHEHSDGSLVFRFGEVVENVELEKPVIMVEEIENKGKEEFGVVDLDGDSEVEIMVEKGKREENGSSSTEMQDESDLVYLEKPVVVNKEIGNKGVIEPSAVGDLDGGDRENEVMVTETESEVNGSGLTELADEFDPVELETPVTVDEEIETDDMGQSSVVKVLDGDHESEVMFKEVEREVDGSTITELPEEFNPVGVVEGGNESSGLEDELSVPMSSMAVEVSSSPEPDIQNIGYNQEVLNEDHEDLSLENVTVADEISEIDNTIVTEELSEKNIGNATTMQAVPLEPENNISQSSIGIAVTVDDLLVSEHQNVDAALNNGTMSIEDTNYSEVVENSTDVTVDSVEAESQNEVSVDGIEINSSELLSNSTNLQVDVSFSEQVECETSQVSVQSVEMENECENFVNDISAKSQLEADITDIEAQTSETGSGFKNEIVKDESESDLMQITSLSPQLAAELQNEIIEDEDSRVIASSELLSNSPNPQVDVSLSEVAACQTSQVPLQNVVTGIGSEVDAIDIVSDSPQFEAATNLSTEIETRTSETGIEIANQIVNESESGVIKFTSISPPLEAVSKLDEEMCDVIVENFKEDEITDNDGTDGDMIQLTPVPPQEKVQSSLHEETDSDSLEELQDDERILSPSMTNDVPRDLVLETERISGNGNLQISQLPVASKNEVVEPESARYSEEILTDFVLSSGAALLPHPTKVLTGGEDAYFVTGQTWLGVADGVLQWSLDGTIPGVYAQDLIRNCEKLASDCKGNSIRYPLDLLNSSVADTLSSGCSTVLLARFDGQVLHVANVGDSGFIILRHGTVYKRSLPMLHAFHLPLQIERGDDPSQLAELYQVYLEEDDVIVTATDGLFDNLYDQEISSIVFKSLAADLKMEGIAKQLATKAQEVGRSTSSRSPFADSAQAAGYVGYTGGKLDDVTVIVSVVKKQSSSVTS